MKANARKGVTPPVIDPYLPDNGNFGYRVSRYELDLEYKVASNRLSGSATITAVALAIRQQDAEPPPKSDARMSNILNDPFLRRLG